MNTSKIETITGTNEGRPASLGEKVCWTLLVGMLTWLFYNQ
jgi:hypothetical protein